ncbi:MAG TPA: acyl-CoA dehydrogenase family protein [Limnochorda sp.]
MDFDLTQEQRAIRDMVRAFAREELAPQAAEYDRTGLFPEPILKRLAELDLFALPLPQAYGGLGGDTVSYALAVEELAWADASVALTYAAHCSLGAGYLSRFGSHEQKACWLPLAARGEGLIAFGLTEPASGSDAAHPQTRAERRGDGWLLNGSKAFITNAAHAAATVIMAATRPGGGRGGVSAFLVPAGTPGFTVGAQYEKLGLRSCDTAPLYLQDVFLGPEALVGEEGRGYEQALDILDSGRIGIAALAVGVGQAALDRSLAYARNRTAFGQSLSRFQAIRFKLADMATELELARTAYLRAAWLKDQGRPYRREAAMAKLFASEAATRAANTAIQIHGGLGYTREGVVERYWRDVRLMEIGEGTSEILRLVIAREIGA